jgi:hypothetical protein
MSLTSNLSLTIAILIYGFIAAMIGILLASGKIRVFYREKAINRLVCTVAIGAAVSIVIGGIWLVSLVP